MPYKREVIPMVKGQDESFSLHVRPQDRMTSVTNGRFNKYGEIVKRHGFTELEETLADTSHTLTSLGLIRGLFSTGKELCAITSRRLYAYNETQGEWYDRGAVSPCVANTTRRFYGADTWESCDMGLGTEYYIFAAQGRSERVATDAGSVSRRYTLRVQGKGVDGQDTFNPTDLVDTANSSERPHGVRVCGLTTKTVVAACIGGATASSATVLRLWSYGTETTPSGPPAVQSASWKTNVLYAEYGGANGDHENNFRPFDLIAMNGRTQYGVVWIDHTTGYVHYALHDIGHATVVTRPLKDGDSNEVDGAYMVAACEDPTNDRLILIVWREAGNEGSVDDELHLFGFDRVTGNHEWGPLVVDTLGANDVAAPTLGVCHGEGPGVLGTTDVEKLVCIYGKKDATALGALDSAEIDSWKSYTRTATTAGAAADAAAVMHNMVWTSKPFNHNNRFYCAATYHTRKHYAFGFSGIYDLHADDDGENDSPRLAALYDIGYAPTLGDYGYEGFGAPITMGSCNSIVPVDADGTVPRRFKFMSISLSAFPQGGTDAALEASELRPRCSVDEMELRFDDWVTADSLLDGTAVIGGGYVTWYSGHETCELGFPSAPIIVNLETINAATGPAIDTYYVQAVWEWHDGAGTLHRSCPSPEEELNHSQEGIKYAALTYPGSWRTARDVNAVFYRSSDQATFERVNDNTTVIYNLDSAGATVHHYELNDNLGSPLYTQSELEAVSPEGSRIVKSTGGVLWLGDMVRRERIQPSKPFIPGTASETAVAPEFNEAFNRIMPDGASVTGMAKMDDKLIVFTERSIFMIAAEATDATGSNPLPSMASVSSDAGCVDGRSIVETPTGVMFQGARGIYELSRGLAVKFVGFPVVDQTTAYPTIVAACINPATSEVYFACVIGPGDPDGTILVYNYAFEAWTQWFVHNTNEDNIVPIGMCMHNGDLYIATNGENSTGVLKLDTSTYKDCEDYYVPMTVETAWIQSLGQGAWQRMRRIMPICALKDPHNLTVEVKSGFVNDTKTVTLTGAQIATFQDDTETEQVVVRVKRQKDQAFKVTISDAVSSSVGTPTVTGEGYAISGIAYEWMQKRGLPKHAEAQRY